MIKIHNACKRYSGVNVLDNVSIQVKKSGILGLAGPSGSGKSTLLRCLQKLETLDDGSLECNGKTGFMFQDFQLFPHMTALENIVYAPNLSDRSAKRRRNNEKRAREMLKNLGIESKMYEYPESLSGGQKQRVALARSLMVNPDILLCDEPTSGLDVATTMDVVSLLKSVGETGVAMIIASHDLDFLTKISDRIILLREGKIVVDIKTEEHKNPVIYLKKYYVDD
ncbi:MAG: ATP-binding cassette domain-containing protein [Holosporaceae bacterium]|jgi:polar amino acid transport system ATP-binding protein|nr:ATP-binding cassette domain-containing protein [Holosporaceae bacterium]